MDTSANAIPATAAAPRKDMNKLKRKRSKSVSTAASSGSGSKKRCVDVDYPPTQQQQQQQPVLPSNTAAMDLEQLLADLEGFQDDELQLPAAAPTPERFPAAAAAAPSTKPVTQVHYYTYAAGRMEPPQHLQQTTTTTATTSANGGYEVYQPEQQQHAYFEPPPPLQPPLTSYKATPKQLLQSAQQQSTKQQQQQLERQLHFSQPKVEPKLLLRQMYRLCNQTDVVIGVESLGDFKASLYLVSTQSCISFTFQDLMCLARNVNANSALDKYFNGSEHSFKTLYFDSVLIKPNVTVNSAVLISNYQVRMSPAHRQALVDNNNQVLCETSPLQLNASGWHALKRLLDCMEKYYTICIECSPCVKNLISRYCQYFVKHYRTSARLAAATDYSSGSGGGGLRISPETERHIVKDLPLFLADFNETRLPYSPSGDWFRPSPLQEAMLPWIDAEVRRYCSPNICEAILQDIKYDLIKW